MNARGLPVWVRTPNVCKLQTGHALRPSLAKRRQGSRKFHVFNVVRVLRTASPLLTFASFRENDMKTV